MRVYFFQFSYLIRKAILVMMIILAGVLAFKMIESNLLEPAVSNFDPIYQGNAGSKKIALTVNVFWGEDFIPPMLDIVKKNDVKMTFFMGGTWVKAFPDLTRQIAKDHELGNHSYSHPHPTFISKAENIKEIKMTEDLISKTAQVTTKLYAPPYGEFNKTVLEAAGDLGYQTILWSIDTIDWQRPAPEIIIRRVLEKAHNGAIVLMHPTDPMLRRCLLLSLS